MTAVPEAPSNVDKEEVVKRPRVVKNSEDFFNAKEYAEAIDHLKKAYSKVKTREEKAEISRRLAESYKFTFNYKAAEAQYKRAIKLKQVLADNYIGVAEMLKYQGEYKEAIEAYNDFSSVFPDDPRGLIGVKSCNEALEWQNNKTRYQVGNLSSLNSRSNDFGITFSGRPNTFEEVLFTSMREGGIGRKDDGWTGQKFSDIYSSERLNSDGSSRSKRSRGRSSKSNSTAARIQKFNNPELLPEIINTEDHEGSPIFDSRRRTMYFTRCMELKRQQLGCSIYTTRKAGLSWQEPQAIIITSDSSRSVGHPSLSKDDKILYFAGDLKGTTNGSKDLWLVRMDKRKRGWSEPVNLGSSINTSGDELFPFVHDDGYLYFASNGLPGMGGFDLFRIKLGPDGIPMGIPENLKAPINSSADDFNILLRPGGLEDGYFVSNRSGGVGGDDIWTLYEVPLRYRISGMLSSSKDNSPIAGASVKVNGNDGFSKVVKTSKDGTFMVESEELKKDVQYSFSFEKKKFLVNNAGLNTSGLKFENFDFVEKENIFLHTSELKAQMDPIEIPIVLPDVYFALAKWDLNQSATNALDTVFKTLERNPNIVIELRSHTDYRDIDEKNMILSQRRADTSVKYLISRGVDPNRLVPVGMGESTPFEMPESYKGLGSEIFAAGTKLTEQNIKKMSSEKQEIANQINRRTDFRVIRDDYVPPVDPDAITENSDEKKKEKLLIGKIYTVGERPSYTTICRENNITLANLKKLNGGLRGIRPFTGMILKVTAKGDYKEFDSSYRQIKSGDSYRTIAKEIGMKTKALQALNPEYEKDLPPGTYIRIQ